MQGRLPVFRKVIQKPHAVIGIEGVELVVIFKIGGEQSDANNSPVAAGGSQGNIASVRMSYDRRLTGIEQPASGEFFLEIVNGLTHLQRIDVGADVSDCRKSKRGSSRIRY